MNEKERIVRAFVDAYNRFDVAAMLADLHPEVVFRNYSGGGLDMEIRGIAGFTAQAEFAAEMFSERHQEIVGIEVLGESAETAIEYVGTLAADLPNGLKAGQSIRLNGRSVYRFDVDLIVSIEDFS